MPLEWKLEASFVHLTNRLVYVPVDRDASGGLTMLVHPNLDTIQVGDQVISTPQILRLDTSGHIAAMAGAPDGRATDAAVTVRVNDAGATLLAWATPDSITLAVHDPDLVRQWSYDVAAFGISQMGAEFRVDLGPSGEAALLTHDDFVYTLTLIDPTGSVRWTQQLAYGDYALGVQFSPDGDVFEVTSSTRGPLRRYRSGTNGAVLQELVLPEQPSILEPDGGYFVIGPLPASPSLARAVHFDATGVQNWFLELGKTEVTDATRSVTGDLVITTASGDDPLQTLRVFDAASGQPRGEAAYCGGNLLSADANGYTTISASGARFVVQRYPSP